MRTFRSLRQQTQTGLRRTSAGQRRRVVQAWRELADVPRELSREVTRRLAPADLQPVRVPTRR